MKTKLCLIIGLLFIQFAAYAQTSATVSTKMSKLIDEQFNFAASQYKLLAKRTPPDRMPKTYYSKTDSLETSDTKWWTSGFFPGSLLYIYEYTHDQQLLEEAERRLNILEKEKHFTGHHDLGFMMFCSFGNAYRLTGNPSYKLTIDTAAASLATRYRPNAKIIQSWGSSANWQCPVIIDNMMNLELLYWVSDKGGEARFKEIAIQHSNSTIKNHFRPDYSSYHVVDYDINTGKVLKKPTAQGAADSSAWSRGQSWGLYGYTMMYRFTKDSTYLNQARHIASFILDSPNLPKDGIPYWDFDAPGIPNALRDASSAAIISSALLELGQYTFGKEKRRYVSTAEKMLRKLASADYRARTGENGGFILKHSVGSIPHKSEVDVPLTYADYYFLEALLRYKKWYL
ncbi:glucuronyl hydrolase [Solitalea longa]|uniref:Glucuronyl hydrolase n=1 Tax=Solitalea longa TaxID=2079460 RepID=A0A2S5A7H0_9SPHI|nr:glycoside hydrolase family 88 protein [Solitalea longa]POY38292.1 glucuronyl hydrolase [Solitalea longa]